MEWMYVYCKEGTDALSLQVREELAGVGVATEPADKILAAMAIRSLEDLEKLLGPDNEAVADLQQLFQLAEAYGMADWLVFDASVVRGLSYYTGKQYLPLNARAGMATWLAWKMLENVLCPARDCIFLLAESCAWTPRGRLFREVLQYPNCSIDVIGSKGRAQHPWLSDSGASDLPAKAFAPSLTLWRSPAPANVTNAEAH